MDIECDDADGSSTNWIARTAGTAAAILVTVGMVGPATVAAQDLPTVDSLESGQVDEEGDDSSGQAEPAGEASGDDQGDQAASGQTAGEAGAANEGNKDRAADDGIKKVDGKKGAERAGSDGAAGEASKEGEEAQKDKAEAAKASEKGEKAQKDKQDKYAGEGEIIDEKTETKKELAGRAGGPHPRRVQDGVNAEGVPGFQHITSAAPQKVNTYRISFFGEVSSASNVIRTQDTNSFVAGRLSLHAQPIKYFSANLSLGARNNVNNFGRPEAMLSQGDLSLGLRGHYDPKKYLDIAADLTIDVPTGFGTAGIDFSGTSVTPQLLGTLDINPLISQADVPLTAHLNFGYRVDSTQNMVPSNVQLTRVERFAHGISAYDYLEFGLGVEYALPYVTPFLSWNFSAPVAGAEGICSDQQSLECASEAGFASFPNVLSLGVKAQPVEQLALHAGLDLSLSARDAAGVPVTPPYMLVLGGSWTIDPEPKIERITKHTTVVRQVEKMPPRGHIVATVVNAETGEPVGGAQVAYAGTDRTPQVTGTDNGKIHSYAFPPDTEVTMRVSHPDYKAGEVTKTIEEGEQTVKVELKPAMGTVAGVVTGPGGEPVSGARVKVVGPQTKETTTDGTGAYSVSVKPGTYSVSVIADNYMAGGGNAAVELGAESSVDVGLKAEPEERLAEMDGDTIKLDARVAFESGSAKLKDESKDILDQVAAMLFKHPELARVEVQGHTDSSGSKADNMELSRKRAQAVKDYLVEQGVDGGRLSPKGYGPEQPKVPNITPSNRRMNRRVEFKVLQRR